MLGNLGEIAKLMSKFKDLQGSMKKFKAEIPDLEFSATSPCGKVKVTLTGELMLKNIEIAADAEPAKVAEAVTAAFNSAALTAKSAIRERMKSVTGDLGIELPF